MRTLTAWMFATTFLFPLLSGNVVAEVYKCKNDAGQLIFSDKPCGQNPQVLDIPNTKPRRPSAKPFNCPSGVSAVVNNLHYPGMTDVDEAIRIVESDYTSLRYRKLIQKVDPTGKLPERVSIISAEGFPASEVPGFSSGVVVNAKICK